MSTSKSTLDYFLELLSGIPDLHAKAMFGEYGIYGSSPHDKICESALLAASDAKLGTRGVKMFALACDNTLFFKTLPETIHLFEDTETKAYPGRKNTAPANPDWLEQTDELSRIALLTLELIPPPKPKKKVLPKN